MRAYLTLFAMLEANPHLFDDLALPGDLSAETLQDHLMLECADLEVLYPNPVTMQTLIGIWSRAQLEVWEKLLATTKFDYDPIYNYDRHFTSTDSTERSYTENRKNLEMGGRKDTRSTTDDLSISGTDNSTHSSTTTGTTVNSGSDTTQREKAAFNASELQIDSKDTVTAGTQVKTDGTVTSTDESSKSETDNRAISETAEGTSSVDSNGSTAGDERGTVTRTERGYGNIGVTTTQQMIQQEREVVAFNMYEVITDSFKQRFCLLIY